MLHNEENILPTNFELARDIVYKANNILVHLYNKNISSSYQVY